MSKVLLVISIALFSTAGFAKGTVPHRAPANAAVDSLAPLPDPLAPLPAKSCDEAMKAADSGVVSDAEDAADICGAAVETVCGKLNNGTGDGRYVSAYCRANAAHAGYKAAKGKK